MKNIVQYRFHSYLMRMLKVGCICSGIMAASCYKKPMDSLSSEPNPSTNREDRAIFYSNKLKNLPFWSRLKKNESAKINELMKTLGEIASQETEIIRRAIELHIAYQRSENSFYFEEWSNLYVLNRLAFNVPAYEKIQDVRSFGGWEYVPHDDKKMNILWPLTLANDGNLELVGFHPGYNGDEFMALREFDYLLDKYGRRPSKLK